MEQNWKQQPLLSIWKLIIHLICFQKFFTKTFHKNYILHFSADFGFHFDPKIGFKCTWNGNFSTWIKISSDKIWQAFVVDFLLRVQPNSLKLSQKCFFKYCVSFQEILEIMGSFRRSLKKDFWKWTCFEDTTWY